MSSAGTDLRPEPTVGVMMHSDFGPERPHPLGTYLRRFVETVEEAGLDGIYIATEIGWDRFGPLACLGALAAWTERIQLGTCVLLAPLHDPLQLAEEITTAQVLSGGRVVLGLGMGWRREEFDAVGVDLDARLGRLQEHLATLPHLLAGENVDHRGCHYHLAQVRVGLADSIPPVPIWLGAHGRAGIARAGRRGLVWIASPFVTEQALGRQVAVYREALEAAGQRFERLPLMRECVVAETRAEAWRAAEALRAKYQEYAARLGTMPFDASAPLVELATQRFAIGDPDDCAESLAGFVAASGATDLVLRIQFRGSDPQATLRSVALLGTEVVPRLRALLASGSEQRRQQGGGIGDGPEP